MYIVFSRIRFRSLYPHHAVISVPLPPSKHQRVGRISRESWQANAGPSCEIGRGLNLIDQSSLCVPNQPLTIGPERKPNLQNTINIVRVGSCQELPEIGHPITITILFCSRPV